MGGFELEINTKIMGVCVIRLPEGREEVSSHLLLWADLAPVYEFQTPLYPS